MFVITKSLCVSMQEFIYSEYCHTEQNLPPLFFSPHKNSEYI